MIFKVLCWTKNRILRKLNSLVRSYDRESHIGKLDKGLDEAHRKGWTVVDMNRDWSVVYSADR